MLFLMAISASAGAAEPVPLSSWQSVVEVTPYRESRGAHANLATIRRWVLASEGYCSEARRHILFDRRMRFLGYLSDPGDREDNQRRINQQRLRLAQLGKVSWWAPGDEDRTGYPFVLSCYQPHARLAELVGRYVGDDPAARLWGTWDGMRVGSKARPVSLHQALREVYAQRRAAERISLPEHVLSILAGAIIIESGGVREAESSAGALGILQLSPAAMNDCRLAEPFKLHRLAQIDCALSLLEQNHRNLEPIFSAAFGHLPTEKSETLYRMLLVQAYHSGLGRVSALLTDESLNGAARYFAANAERFTAGDIALGVVFHNLGREQLGFAALYYVTDVGIATEAACRRVDDLPGCPVRPEARDGS